VRSLNQGTPSIDYGTKSIESKETNPVHLGVLEEAEDVEAECVEVEAAEAVG